MTFFDTQNPGIGGFDELTLAEELFIQNLASLAYQDGDLLYYDNGDLQRLPIGNTNQILQVIGGLPAWGVALTVSASAPSSPAVNDLWYDIS